MIARITTPKSLSEALNYHEHKVRRGVAVCLAENNFLLPLNAMNFYHKLTWFELRNMLNDRATTKTLHVSLNFAVSEEFDNNTLTRIAFDYMNRIGFGDQPFLLYKHKDAGHPHVHVLATTIREDGTHIPLHNIGRNQSEIARKLIENKYGLVHAQKTEKQSTQQVTPAIHKLEYGKAELKRSISNVLVQVINLYNYTSLPEFNAVLIQFGVMADRGKEGSFTHRKNGLLYRMLDASGQPVGVPIKASAIAGKPTLAHLEKKFTLNKQNREVLILQLQNTIRQTVDQRPANLDALIKSLSKQNIYTLLRQNTEGRIYGITFVDNKNRSVFNGSELGREFSIAGIMHQLENPKSISHHQHQKDEAINTQIVDQLLQPVDQSMQQTPSAFRKKRKKKNHKPQ